jgi:hypothetical protein
VIARKVLIAFVLVAIIVPMVVLLLIGVAKLLAVMGDSLGAVCLDRLALAGGVLWGIDLLLLLVALSVNAIDGHD